MLFSDSTSLYFYSALFQGNAALVTLSAMFVISKKQAYDQVFEKLEKIAIEYLKGVANVSANYGSIFEFETFKIESHVNVDQPTQEKIERVMAHPSWKERFLALRKIDAHRANLLRDASRAMSLILLALMASIVLLPFSTVIHQSVGVELALFLAAIAVEIFGLFRAVKFVLS